jgi:transcriptional regulator with XRE-family HTH domain
MRDLELGHLVRALRRRRGWRQADCAMRASLHRSSWSNLERGLISAMAVETLRRCLAVLEVKLDLVPRWHGPVLERLLDERHASLQAAWKARLERWGWLVRAEVSYSRYGERGRIDLLAWHPQLRILLVIEIKTEIVDLQDLLGSMDVKRRLAPLVADQVGFGRARFVVPVLIVSEDASNRRRVVRFASLFGHLSLRGKRAISWMRLPDLAAASAPDGLLVFSNLSPATSSRVRRVGGVRVRPAKGSLSVDPGPGTSSRGAEVG